MTGWLPYTRKHINTSYGKVREVTRKRGEFLRPIPLSTAPRGGMFGSRWVNFYELGTTFYSAAKLLDDYGLIGFMEAQRHVYANTNQIAFSLMGNPPYMPGMSNAHLLISSVQNERLLNIFNQDRLNAERFVTTNLRHAIELCLKALAATANRRIGKGRTFLRGHKLDIIYNDLPKGLREEIGIELPKFASAYAQHVNDITKASKTLRQSSPQAKALLDVWDEKTRALNQVITDLNAGGYIVPSSNLEGWDPSAGTEQLIRALKDGPSFDEHRYGPEIGPDEYSTQWVANALITGQFFYEHLFPVPLIRHDDGSGPLSEMRGPL